ncbi:MAG TPA: DinB family protein [Candidatus Limnocylindrales bacterium]|nr:DinB family protein [Candidatus Limnocylindrales bacterium]
MYPRALRPFYEGWANYQSLVIAAIRDLSPDALELRSAPQQWAVWQLAAHIAGTRAYWFHDVLREGDASISDMFRVAHTTVPDLPLDEAGWEDAADQPRDAAELVDALTRTWDLVDACLRRWTPEDLEQPFERRGQTDQRGWVVWHVMEHDVHHGGEISQILGSNGLPSVDI